MSHSSIMELKTQLQALTREIQDNLTHAERCRNNSSNSDEVLNNCGASEQALSSLLHRQDTRLNKIEQSLLTATEQVLSSSGYGYNRTSPSSRGSSRQSSLCATQLVERFRSMYEDQGRQMQRLQIDDDIDELNDAPFDEQKVSNEMALLATAATTSQDQPPHPTVFFQHRQSFFDEFHRQLDAVVETDHETDSSSTTTRTTTITPASSSRKITSTPASWKTAAASSTPGSLATPPTPNLSLNTTRILLSLPKQQRSTSLLFASSTSSSEHPVPASSPHHESSSSSSPTPLVSNEDRNMKATDDDENLMRDVSLAVGENAVETVIHEKQTSVVTAQDIGDKDEQDGSDSSNSEDEDVSLNRDDTYDEEDFTVATEPTIVNPHRHHLLLDSYGSHNRNDVNNDAQNEGEDEDENAEKDEDDDSAAYCPTIRQDRPVFAQNHGMLVKSTQVTSMDSPPRQPKDRPSHIEVDMEMPSPTPTNITMDTVMEDQVLNVLDYSNRPKPDTSVLDRYRLDRDDDSPLGVKVVPVPNAFASPPPKQHATSSFSKSPSTPNRTSPAQRSNKRVFRKTPHPSKSKVLPPTINENEPLEFVASFSPHRGQVALPLSSQYSNNMNRKNSVESRSTIEKNLSPNQPICIPSLRSVNESTRDKESLRPVELHEYKQAPRIFQMQVSHDELNNAIAVLQNDRSFTADCVWTRAQLHDRLAPFGFSERKEKSILMSLCHFRRLIMQRKDNDNILFRVPA